MKKRLILLTSGFPYGKGEIFLENEINYLAGKFYQGYDRSSPTET